MKESKSTYFCQNCGAVYVKWSGKCEACQQWNTLILGAGDAEGVSEVKSFPEITLTKQSRNSTGIQELDRVLGGGLVQGSVVLVGGEPGIGKSTLLLQVLGNLSIRQKVLYVTGEESLEQIALRGKRLALKVPNLFLLAEMQVEKILSNVRKVSPEVLVIDSIQTMYTNELEAAPSSISQLREATAKLINYGKKYRVSIIIVGHVTKEGVIAGPKILEHMVDCVLYFEGGEHTKLRMLRCVKNRFGAVNEMGIFAMTESGLKEINNPSAIFLASRSSPMPGSSVTVTLEGTRPILVEIQTLIDKSYLPNPRRTAVGYEVNRLGMMLAILNRHSSLHTYDRDVYVNVVGGIKITETAVDVSLMLAIFSSFKNLVLPEDWASFGEVGLGGEIRPVPNGQERIKVAKQHQFTKLIIPTGNLPRKLDSEIELIGVKNLKMLLELVG